jgi:hypothetical protein
LALPVLGLTIPQIGMAFCTCPRRPKCSQQAFSFKYGRSANRTPKDASHPQTSRNKKKEGETTKHD